MRRGRFFAALALAALIAPGHWWRSAPVADRTHMVRFERLAAEPPRGWPAGLTLSEAWHLDPANTEFSGFSGLIIRDGQFTGFTDFGGTARIPRPPAQPLRVEVQALPRTPDIANTPDLEAAAWHQASGTLWLSYEHHNAIRRIAADGTEAFVRPAALQGLGANSGIEAMARLPDGHFLMLAERGGRGFLFAGDPVDAPRVTEFSVALPGDYRPTDVAALPDGRVLVLLRSLEWAVPPFASMLAVGDPAAIRVGEEWQLEPLAIIDQTHLRENYEGLAVEPASNGALTLWLISDSNRAVFQRTLLLKLRWQPQLQTAREGNPREPQSSP